LGLKLFKSESRVASGE